MWSGFLDEAREVFTRLQAMTAQSGIEFQRPYRAFDLANVELAAGRLPEAAQLVDDGLESAFDAGNLSAVMWLRYADGRVHAHLGDRRRPGPTGRRGDARLGSRSGRAHPGGDGPPRCRCAGAHRRDGPAALDELLAGVAISRRQGFAHPGVVPVLPDAIEAATLVGDAGVAADLATELDGQAAALDVPWVTAAARRGDGLAAIAAGDRNAHAALAEAAVAFDAVGYRLDAARAWLWHGRALQRAGRRAAAADALAEVRDRFLAMHARPWAEQAAADLERVAPGRTTGALTDDEARIAELVLDGRRNREIAASLFVSVATVEAHLTRIYRKLGVRSRSELSRRLLESRRSDQVGQVPSSR